MLLFLTCLSLSTVDSNAIHISFKMDRNIVDIFMAFSLCFFLQQIVLCVPKRNIFVCVERFFHPLANFSYTLYLTHRITLLLIFNSVFIKWSHNLDMKGIVLYILLLTTCMLTSWSIYYFIVSDRIKENILDAKIHSNILGSDHCPIELDI